MKSAAILVALLVGFRADAASLTFELAVGKVNRSGEQAVMAVHQGDDVTIHVTTERSVEIHLHGYDIEENASPGKAALLRFSAHAAGRFPIEIHEEGKHRVVGYLEVHPR